MKILTLLVNVAHVVSQNGHQRMLVYKGHQQKTCLKKEYHIRNNATKTSLIKYITTEQRPRVKKNGKEQLLQP